METPFTQLISFFAISKNPSLALHASNPFSSLNSCVLTMLFASLAMSNFQVRVRFFHLVHDMLSSLRTPSPLWFFSWFLVEDFCEVFIQSSNNPFHIIAPQMELQLGPSSILPASIFLTSPPRDLHSTGTPFSYTPESSCLVLCSCFASSPLFELAHVGDAIGLSTSSILVCITMSCVLVLGISPTACPIRRCTCSMSLVFTAFAAMSPRTSCRARFTCLCRR